jgi:transcriptional antiterminator RfaH
MPTLPQEPNLYPAVLFENGLRTDSQGRLWWVVHTKPRQEKSLARQLHEGGVPFYLPLIARRSLVRGRIVTAHIPLFTSYVFLLADEKERLTALSSRRIVHTLQVTDQPQLWDDLNQLQRLIQSGAPITPEERLAPGMAVEIRSGPLAGLRGKILRTATGKRFVVEVNFIQRGASVEVDDFALTRLPVDPDLRGGHARSRTGTRS